MECSTAQLLGWQCFILVALLMFAFSNLFDTYKQLFSIVWILQKNFSVKVVMILLNPQNLGMDSVSGPPTSGHVLY